MPFASTKFARPSRAGAIQLDEIVWRKGRCRWMGGELLRVQHPEVQDLDATLVAVKLYDVDLVGSGARGAQQRRQPRKSHLAIQRRAKPDDDLACRDKLRRVAQKILRVLRVVVGKALPE